MNLNEKIYKLRKDSGLTREEFAEKFNVSRQAVSKWENGDSMPDIDNIIKIAKFFNVTIDYLLLDSNARMIEENEAIKKILPDIGKLNTWELYSEDLMTEYVQCMEEGLDIEKYKSMFHSISKLDKGNVKEKFADVIFEIVSSAMPRKDYIYNEPSKLEDIQKLSKCDSYPENQAENIKNRVKGAWYGRICGCLLGKIAEGIRRDELVSFLKETQNYPMHRYVLSDDINEKIQAKYKFRFNKQWCADIIDSAPADDDTNYTVLYQKVIEKHGKDFNSSDIATEWLEDQNRDAYFTAERVAFRNFINGYYPPNSALYKNPYREWIGAQIRADYFGYINPGNPKLAAEMAYRDASISHTKNGIYGEMFAAAMIARAAVSDDIVDIILCGISQIPTTSRLYEAISKMVEDYRNGVQKQEALKKIYAKYDDTSMYDWCHTISNACIVVYALLYGENDYGKSICLAVEAAFDTDCNGATVGSVLGMKNSIDSIGKEWTDVVKGKLHTNIFRCELLEIDTLVDKTIKHIG